MVHQHQGDYPAALEKLNQARSIFAQIGAKPDLALAEQAIELIKQKLK